MGESDKIFGERRSCSGHLRCQRVADRNNLLFAVANRRVVGEDATLRWSTTEESLQAKRLSTEAKCIKSYRWTYELCIITNNIDIQNVISVQPVGLIKVTSPVAIVQQYLQLRLLSLVTFCDSARSGSWEN